MSSRWPIVLRALRGRSTLAVSKQTVVVAVVAATVINFTLFGPALRYSLSEGYRQAAFDFFVNGPMNQPEIDLLGAIPAVVEAAPVADVTPLYLEFEGHKATLNQGRYVDDPAAFAQMYPSTLLAGGALATAIHPGQIILDQRTADALQASVGDRLSAKFVFPDDTQRAITYTLASIYDSTAQLDRSLGAIMSDAERPLVDSVGVRYSSAFLMSSDPAATKSALDAQLGSTDLVAFSRTDLLNEAIANIDLVLDPTRERVFLVLGFAIFALFVGRELAGRIARRSREIAVLLALGAHESEVATALLVEQAAVTGFAAAIGAIGGLLFFNATLGLPYAFGDIAFLVVGIAGLAVAALVASVLVLYRRLRRLPVARLIGEGA